MAADGFVHLRVRSAYSLLEGAIKADKIGDAGGADAGMPAVGVADRANLFGALEFSQATKDAGVQPIVGLRPAGHRHRRGAARALGQGPDHRAAGPERGRLAQPARPCRPRPISTPARWTSRSVPWAKVAAHVRGADPAVRRAGRAGRSAVRRRARRAEAHAALADDAARPSATASTSSCSATACRPRPPAEPGLVAWAYDARRAAGRHQRRLFRQGRTCTRRTTPCCASPTAPSLGQDERRRVTGRALVQAGRGHARAVRRPAGGLRQHPRDRPPLRLHGPQARPDPAALRHRRRAAPSPRNWRTRPARG